MRSIFERVVIIFTMNMLMVEQVAAGNNFPQAKADIVQLLEKTHVAFRELDLTTNSDDITVKFRPDQPLYHLALAVDMCDMLVGRLVKILEGFNDSNSITDLVHSEVTMLLKAFSLGMLLVVGLFNEKSAQAFSLLHESRVKLLNCVLTSELPQIRDNLLLALSPQISSPGAKSNTELSKEMFDNYPPLRNYLPRKQNGLPEILYVKFDTVQVSPGKNLSPSEVINRPDVKWNAAPNKKYALMMLDMNDNQNLHWLITNISANDVSKGENVWSYHEPKLSKPRAYIIMIYRQRSLTGTSMAISTKFDYRGFASLQRFGSVVAVNYFFA